MGAKAVLLVYLWNMEMSIWTQRKEQEKAEGANDHLQDKKKKLQ